MLGAVISEVPLLSEIDLFYMKVERSLMEQEVSRSSPTNAFTDMWKRSAQQPC